MPAGTMARLTMVAGITAAVTMADTAGAAEFYRRAGYYHGGFYRGGYHGYRGGYHGGYHGGGFRRR